MNAGALHRRLASAMALTALVAFMGGAGMESASTPIAGLLLLLSVFWQPGERIARPLEIAWRVGALVLSLRAGYAVFIERGDVVLPMVDLLLLLLVAEALRRRDGGADARLYSLSFALLVASTAYRPGLVFGVSFVAYVVLTTMTLFVGNLAREAERAGVPRVRPGRSSLVQIGALSAVVLLFSGTVFTAFPRVTGGWISRPAAVNRSIVGFGDAVSLAEYGGRIEDNPQVALRVEFPGGRPPDVNGLYWRGRAYDGFDGVRWHRSYLPGVSVLPTMEGWTGPEVDQVIYGVPLEARVLFGLAPVLSVRAHSRIQPTRDAYGDFAYLGAAAPVYAVRSATGRPDAESLRGSGSGLPPGAAYYLRLPPLSERMKALADTLGEGAATRYDRVLAVERWLKSNFSYTLDLPRNAREATLESFLFERRVGHCEYFSTAMAVLLRAQGIPTRNVNGFLGGEWNDVGGVLVVTQNQAHSWVEVWFPGFGWVPFDPTPPGAAGTGSRAAGIGRLRFLLDGLEHRWTKWVLDYDLDTQLRLFDRISGVDSPDGLATASGTHARWIDVLAWSMAAAIAVFLGVLLYRRRDGGAAESRAYLRMRRAYAGWGVGRGEVAPFAFAAELRRREAPGLEAAARAVRRYVRTRFGGEALEGGEREAYRRDVRQAVSAVRRARLRRIFSRGRPGDPS